MFVFKKITNITKVNLEEVIIYQKQGIHPDGFWVLLRNMTTQWRPLNMYDKTVRDFGGGNVEIIE